MTRPLWRKRILDSLSTRSRGSKTRRSGGRHHGGARGARARARRERRHYPRHRRRHDAGQHRQHGRRARGGDGEEGAAAGLRRRRWRPASPPSLCAPRTLRAAATLRAHMLRPCSPTFCTHHHTGRKSWRSAARCARGAPTCRATSAVVSVPHSPLSARAPLSAAAGAMQLPRAAAGQRAAANHAPPLANTWQLPG